jgi:hypothetical protein
LSNVRLVARRQRRDAATASNDFFLVAMDKEGWGYNVHGRVSLQEVYRVEARLSALIGEVFEVPTNKVPSVDWLVSSVYPPVALQDVIDAPPL